MVSAVSNALQSVSGGHSPDIRYNYAASAFSGGGGHITLGDWIGRVRCKRREMRRKNANLRVAAMLAVTLRRAEADMRVRQQERAHKWAEMNQQISRLSSISVVCSSASSSSPSSSDDDEEDCLQSPLSPPHDPESDPFEDAHSYNERQRLYTNDAAQQRQQQQPQQQHSNDFQQQQQATDELWRTELSDLDQFIQSLNQVKTCIVR